MGGALDFGNKDLNLGDLDKFYGSQPGGIVGKAPKKARPRSTEPVEDGGSQPATLKAWVKKMDDTNGWPEFDKRVSDFSKQFEVPYAKAVIFILFNVF